MSNFIERLGWVLVHSLWQFALLSAIAFVLQRAMRRASSSARYLVLLGMLAAIVAAPLVTWCVLPVEAPQPVVAAAPASVPMPIPPALPREVMLAPTPVASPPAPLAAASVVPVVKAPPLPPTPLLELPQTTWSERIREAVTPWLSTIVWGWSLGVLAFALRPLMGWITVRRLRTSGVSPVPEAVQAALAATAQRLGITHAVRVLQSAVVQVPIVAGYFQPVILLPVSIVTGMPASQLEAILAHELAHIRRHDYLVNLAQTLVETVFFYHPAVWWLSHQIRCERENCCDDIAVSALGSRLDYSRALLALEELRSVQTPLAIGANGGSLLERVRRLFHREADLDSISSGSMALGVVLVAGVLTIVAIAGGQLTADQADEEISFAGPVADQTSWPQLGGSAAHNSVSVVTNLPTQFDLAKKENIRWSQPIGHFAFSSPVVAAGKVLIGTNNATGHDPRFSPTDDVACLLCFEEATGAFLWQYSSPRMKAGRQQDWPILGICLVPVVEGDRVWFVTNRCEVVCLDLNGHRDNEDDGLPEPEASAPGADGTTPSPLTPSPSPEGSGEPEGARARQSDVVWRYDLFNTLGVRPQKAACVTPTIAGNLLLLNSPNDVDESHQKLATSGAPAFLAFDKTSGQLVWSDKTPNPNILCDGCSMGAPVAPAAALIDGTWQAIFAGYDGWLYAYDLEAVQRGETQMLWKFDLNPKTARLWFDRGIANTPVVVGHRVYAAVGHNADRGSEPGRLWCIDATKRGDLSSDLVYNKSAPDVVIPHKQLAVEPVKGDFTRPNLNSGVVWVYISDDLNQNGKIEHDEQMHLSNSLPVIHDGLLMTTDLNGIFHCLDAATGKRLWSHVLLAASDSGPLIADGKAWIIDEDGTLSIFAISREKQLLAEHHLNSPGYTNLAAANETLYVATKTQLLAIGNVPKAKPLVAKLPGGLEVELVGVTKNFAPSKEGWKPDGSPIGEIDEWSSRVIVNRKGVHTSLTDDGTTDPEARDLLFEMRGLQSQPEIALLDIQATMGWGHLPLANPYRNRLSLLLNNPSNTQTFRMAISDAPWGPYQQIGLDGKLLNEMDLAAPEEEHYGQIRVIRCGPHPDNSEQSELTLEMPDKFQERCAFSIHPIDTEGKEMLDLSSIENDNSGKVTAKYRTDSGLPGKIVRWEYRLRPYRHFITFENVSFEPGKKTEPKVSVESIAVPDSTSKAPPAAHPILQMVESAGTHYNGGNVVKAHIGYTPPLRDGWMNWLEKDATASLEKLPAGKHWLIAKHPWTVFPVELPLASSPLKQTPRAGLPPQKLSSNQYSGELVVEIDKAGKEFIRVNVRNMTDEPWSFSELDLTLGAGWGGEESEAHSPLWLTEKLDETSRVEIAARQTGSFRIDWADWVRRGVWDPMSGVQEQDRPTLPEQQAGKIWVRIGGPGFGTLPVAVAHPDKLLADAGLSKTAATLPGGLELELLGVTPYRGSGQDGWTPQGVKFEKAPEWAAGLKADPLPLGGQSDWVDDDFRDFIVRARGFTKEQRALLPFAGQTIDSRNSTIGRMTVLTWNQQVQRLIVGIPGEWGPYRVLTVDPNVAPKAKAVEVPAEVPALHRKVYESIHPRLEASDAREDFWQKQLMKSFPPDYRPAAVDPDVKPANYTRVVWKGQPANPDLKYTTIEAVLVDLQGKRHTTFGTTNVQDGPSQWDVDLFRVPFDQVSHVEYRLRPYQHVVTFNNVALHVGAECGPNVVVESPLAAADKPPPPLEFRLVATAPVKDPVEFAGQKWFRIVSEATPDSAGKPVVDKSALGLPVERLNASNEHMGLVGDTPATSLPWDGTWHVEKCEVQPDPNGEDRFQVHVTLDTPGGKALRTLTTGALRQRLAILVEERILVAPTVQEPIGTTFVITGNFTKEQAEQLAKSIRRGMAPGAPPATHP